MNYTVLDFLCLLGSVALFLYGMKVMSEGLQKAAGERLRNILSAMTRNRFAGTLTGFLITALIQSSSASTVMVVSFVNAGLISLGQSMAVIMGANVGTTFTAWILALFGFKVNISAFVLPLIGLAIPLLFSSKSRNKSIGEFLIGFGFLFMGLDMISTYVPDLQSNPDMFAFLERYASMGYASVLIFLLVGLVLTMVIQSSAATFAIVLIMCAKGWIGFDISCALILGSNIGTTITPIIASMGGNAAARRTAMGHLMFNVLGTAWCLALFYPFCHFSQWLTEVFGQGDPDTLATYVKGIEASDPDIYNHLFDGSLPAGHPVLLKIAEMQQSVSIGLSLFHTVFNLINLGVMIWFTNLYVKVVVKLVPARHKEEEEFKLRFIQGGILTASELNIAQAEKEILVFAQRVQRMVGMSQNLIHEKDGSEEFTRQWSRLGKYEDISDRMEYEIGTYLSKCAEGRLSNEGKHRISIMLRIDSELEGIADDCYSIGKVLVRKQEGGVKYNDEILNNIDTMFIEIEEAMSNMILLLSTPEHAAEADINRSYNIEREINNMRNHMRRLNVENINTHRYDYQAGISFMEIISRLEKMGDHIVNIVDEIKAIE